MKLSKIYSENRLLILLVSILIILIGLPIIILLVLNKTRTVIAWYDTDWEHRKTVTVSNDTGSTLSNEDVLVTVDTASLISESKLQSDCGDLRFVDSDDSSVLDYWIEGGCNTSTTEVWVQIPSLPSAGKTVYMYYANPTAANGGLSWSGNYIAMFNGSCPSGWSRVTALDNRFPMGSSSYGSTGGNSTHSHTYTQNAIHSHASGTLATSLSGAHRHAIKYAGSSASGNKVAAISTAREWDDRGVAYAGAHTHTITGSTEAVGNSYGTTEPSSSIPPYLTMTFCTPDSSNISILPQDIIFLFESLPTSDYTRYSSLDDRFPMSSSTPGNTGGTASHNHTYTEIVLHSHNVGSLVTETAGSHTHNLRFRDGVTGTYPYISGRDRVGGTYNDILSYAGDHTHTITGSVASAGVSNPTTESESSLPPYLSMIYASQNSDLDSFQVGSITITTDNPPLGWSRYVSLDNKFPMGSSSYGATGGSIFHNHVYNEVPSHTHTAGTLATATAGNHTHTITGHDYITGYQPYPIISSGTYDWQLPTTVIEEAGSHTHTISGSTASAGTSSPSTMDANGLPPYFEVIFSQRKSSQATVLGVEDSPVPNTPTIQPATAISTTEISWNFTDNSTDELGFKVYDETDTLKVTCDTPDISSCSETGLSENTQYTRKVVAYNAFGDSTFSDTVSAYTKAGNIDIINIETTTDTATMTSSTFANPTVDSSGYYFDCTGECHNGINEWIQTNTDQATGLENNTSYKFTVKNRNGDGVENSYPVTAIEVWTKAAVPTISNTDITDTTITLEGTGVNYLAQGSSGLYFDCILGESCDGGINEWISVSTDTVTGLSPDTQYDFKVKARNYDGVETSYSTNTLSLYTDSTQPTITSVDNPTTTSLDVTIDNHNNPATTTYLVEEVNTAKYVEATGNLVVDPTWLTYNQLGSTNGITISGLSSNTEYSFRVKAKNQDDVETIYSDPVSTYTKLEAPTALTPDTKTDTTITWKISTPQTGYDGIKVYDTDDNLLSTCMGSDITQCQETGLTPNTEYSRKLTIYNAQSESTYSLTILENTIAQTVSISTITALNDYEVSITIDLQDNPVGTEVQIFEENSSKYLDENLGILVATEENVTSTGNPITVSGLSPNTEYIFKVRAVDNKNNTTAWSATSSIRTYGEIPIIVSTQALSTSTGTLTIDLGNNPEGTRIAIIENGGKYVNNSGELVDTEQIFEPSTDIITISGLQPNTTYTFKTRSYNEDNLFTQWSSTLDLVTYIETPTVNIIGKTSDTVTLEISEISNIEEGNSGIYVEDIGEWSKRLTQTISGLNPNTQYSFNVKARNSSEQETSYIETDSVYTLATIPSISETVATSTTNGTITIDLKQNPLNTRISIMETNSEKYLNSMGDLVLEEEILATDSNEFIVKGLKANTTYNFKIKAYNEADIATEYSSESFPLTTLIQNPILTVSNITSSSATVVVSGINNVSSGSSGVFVERLNSWSKNLTQNITNLNANTSYTFRVKVRNKDGITSSYVSTEEIQTLANTPSVSSVRKISSNSARVYLDNTSNPSYTQLAVRDRVSNQYINANGRLQDQPVWQTYAQWGGGLGIYVTGLDGLRQVGFEVKARNTEGIETSFSNAEYIGTGSVIKNIPNTISATLKDDQNIDLSNDAQLGVQDIQITKDSYLLANVKVSFEQDRDWQDIVADTDIENSKTVIKVSDKHGIEQPFTMYVVRNDTNAFRICPQATNLQEVNNDCVDGKLLTKDFPQEIELEGSIVTISEAKINGVYYWIADGLTGTGGMGEKVEVTEDINQPEEPDTEETTQVSVISKRVTETAKRISKEIVLGTTEILDSTPIANLNQEELSNAVVTTTTVTVTVGFASTGFIQSFYFVFHFFNSVLNALGFRRKKQPFGYVYDSSSKEPISNAVIRIYKGKELVETTVTNSEGMFLSRLNEGEYRIEVKKGGYNFPTNLVKGNEDYPLKNIYKGGEFVKTETSDLIINIPLDKVELSKSRKLTTLLKSMASIILTLINIALFIFGILLLIYSYYKYPELFKWYIPILYLPALYFLSKSIFSKRTVYGKVIDKNGDPIIGKELYLINKEFEEVVSKRVTDEKGRYRFVCEKGVYDIKMDKTVLLSDIKVKRDGYILAKRLVLN
jgi:hypothetical protein